MTPRWTQANHRVDSVRGCVALERGPQVYCVEQVDLPEQIRLDDVVVDPTQPPLESDGGLRIAVTPRREVGPLYGAPSTAPTGEPVTVRAIPFHTWGNRASGAMRVWLPSA